MPKPVAAAAPSPRALSLKRCLELAVLNYPKVQEARARLAQKNAQLDQAFAAAVQRFHDDRRHRPGADRARYRSVQPGHGQGADQHA